MLVLMTKKEKLHKSSTKITERLFQFKIIFREIHRLSINVHITGVISFNQQLRIDFLRANSQPHI